MELRTAAYWSSTRLRSSLTASTSPSVSSFSSTWLAVVANFERISVHERYRSWITSLLSSRPSAGLWLANISLSSVQLFRASVKSDRNSETLSDFFWSCSGKKEGDHYGSVEWR